MRVEQTLLKVHAEDWNKVKDDSMLINKMIRNKIHTMFANANSIEILRWRSGYDGDDFRKNEISVLVNYII